MSAPRIVAIACLSLIVMHGCATYKVTQELNRPIDHSHCKIEPITDVLPPEMEEDDRPREREISQLRQTLEDELRRTELFTTVEPFNDSSQYLVRATILTFKRGSGAVRALIGFGIGNAKITVDIKLVERDTDAVLFAGNFSQTISDWTEKGDKMYGKIAKDFAGALKKGMKNLDSSKAVSQSGNGLIKPSSN